MATRVPGDMPPQPWGGKAPLVEAVPCLSLGHARLCGVLTAPWAEQCKLPFGDATRGEASAVFYVYSACGAQNSLPPSKALPLCGSAQLRGLRAGFRARS